MPVSDNRFGLRTIVIWGVALVAALWLGATALSGATQFEMHRVALSGYPKSVFAYQTKADADTMGANQSIQQIRVSDADLASALAAVRREPFASGALTLIGIARDQRGDAANAPRIVARAHALDKRQLVANAWLINRYGTAGRDREVLALLDEALKVRPELSDRYMPAFAQALQNSETVPVFQTLLSRHPAWEGDFWSAVALNRAALPNGEVLRSRLLASHHDLDSVDAMLMRAYIQAGRLDLAVSSGKNLPTLPED